MRRWCGQEGQSAVIAVVFLTALLGMSAAVIDLGSWFRADRSAQATADAAALAGAQALPADPDRARALALDYAKRNGDSLTDADVSLKSTQQADGSTALDTIVVSFSRPAPGFFARIFGISSIKVGASAGARAFQPDEARWVAPIVVNKNHPLLAGIDDGVQCPCYGPEHETTLPLGKAGAPGAFDLLNLDPNDPNGTVGTSELASWIDKGFDQYLPLGGYYSSPGAKFASGQIQQALQDRYGTELLFPVYDTLTLQGSNATYHIIAWVGFHLADAQVDGNTGSLSGWFTRVVWDGLEAAGGGNPGEDDGVRSIELVQ
jgi:hypothetical protein